jgi:hypothetical protein
MTAMPSAMIATPSTPQTHLRALAGSNEVKNPPRVSSSLANDAVHDHG